MKNAGLKEVVDEMNKLAVELTGRKIDLEYGGKHPKAIVYINNTKQAFAIPQNINRGCHKNNFTSKMRKSIMFRQCQVTARKTND